MKETFSDNFSEFFLDILHCDYPSSLRLYLLLDSSDMLPVVGCHSRKEGGVFVDFSMIIPIFLKVIKFASYNFSASNISRSQFFFLLIRTQHK